MPNNDGLNDLFRILPVGADGINLKKLNVYNRFGEVVFTTNDITKGWDGRYKRQICDVMLVR